MTRRIDYGRLMHEAMRGLIQRVLTDVRASGLPGDHHFYITFDTTHPGVALADWLRERYPDEMMIVIQHWYDNLEIDAEGFSITLNFGDNPEPLVVPFDAIRTFVDPSVEFGLRFESHDGEETGEDEADEAPMAEDVASDDEDADGKPDAEVVSLDSFRK